VPPDLPTLCRDLELEHGELDAMVSGLDEAGWQTPTPAPGWSIRDQLAHLTFVEGRAALAMEDAEAFAVALADDRADADRFAFRMGGGDEPADGAGALAAWRAVAARFLASARAIDPAAKVPWYGPPMRPASMVSARIMETWAHAEDVADALGITRVPTERLRHVAHLGVGARRWSYTVNGLEPDERPVRVELVAPDGDTWEWAEADAADSVRGPALDFCRVVTRRRLVEDTDLVVTGPTAAKWLSIAQAFAGPPGPSPAKRERR
jgi:uncharacterized protein (TIGR03084 family)